MKKIIAKRLSRADKLLLDINNPEYSKIIITQDELMFETPDGLSHVMFAGDDCRVCPVLAAKVEAEAIKFRHEIENLIRESRTSQLEQYRSLQAGQTPHAYISGQGLLRLVNRKGWVS